MEKQKKRFSRQSTADITAPVFDTVKEQKVQKKLRPNIPKPPQQKNQLQPSFPKQQSSISHLTKRSLFDRKSSHQSDGRAKSVTVKYIGNYKQPGVFGLQDKQFINLYTNDPFAKYKIDYILKKNEQKVRKDKALAATINAMGNSKSKDGMALLDSSRQKVEEPKTGKSFVRCKSQSNLIEALECQKYKQLIVSHSQAYSGCTV